ncbi:MAG: hypothetical protein SXQ77_02700, partial [Halobacteria archaeon]|nr:hypothetical protein [Halobacteria archaeon]
MTFTDNSDVYSAVHEDGINTVIDHLQRKRPSLFHYGTERIIQSADIQTSFKPRLAAAHFDRGVLCAEIDAADEVRRWDNPLMTRVDPLPVIGTEIGPPNDTDQMVKLDYCFQVADLSIDFSPDEGIIVEATSGEGDAADIGEQQFAATVVVCGGLACPHEEEFDRIREEIIRIRRDYGNDIDEEMRNELGLPIIPEPESLNCFCLRVTVVGSAD